MHRKTAFATTAVLVGAWLSIGSATAQTPAGPPIAPPDAAAIAAFHFPPLFGPGETTHGLRAPDAPRPVGAVLETRPPNNPTLHPAFAGQTRAPAVRTRTPMAVKVVTGGLSNPWGMAFLPDGRLLVTESRGALRIVTQDGKVGPPINGTPQVLHYLEASFKDVGLDPDFAHTRRIFYSYVELRPEGNGLTLASARLSADEKSLENITILFRGPTFNNALHYGGRMLITPDGMLYFGIGERYADVNRIKAQDLDQSNGKVLRMTLDGAAPAGNPFAQVAASLPLIWTYGSRNPQGLAIQPGTGALWESEHGPQDGDEINILKPGHNYGWPLAAYGSEYSNKPINGGRTQRAGTDQPVYYWDPTVAPSGMTFYSGALIPEWNGNLFVSTLAGQHLARLVIRQGKVIGEERLLQDQRQRIRDVVQGPDGALWVLTDDSQGRLIRIAPVGK